MDDGVVRVLLVEDNRLDAMIIREALNKSDECQVLVEHANRLADALEWLRREPFAVVLLDLSLPDSHGLDTVVRVHEAVPEVPVVVLTGNDDEQLAIEAVEHGAEDYLVKGQIKGKLVMRAIRYALARHRNRPTASAPSPSGSKIVAVVGAKGGCGATTLAAHLACELQAASETRVLLADLDPACGAIAFLMKAASPYSLADALANSHKLDASFWQAVLATSPHPVDILLGVPPESAKEAAFETEPLRKVLRLIRSQYRWAVLDLGRWAPHVQPLLTEIDCTLLVTAPDVLSLYQAKRIAPLVADKSPTEVEIVLNAMPRRHDIGVEEIERLLGCPIHHTLPEAADDVADAYAQGRLVDRKSPWAASLRHMARLLVGAQAEPEPKGLASSLRQSMMSLLGRVV